MAIRLKQSTASQEVPLGYFVDSADGNTEETALTIANTDIKLWKNGATTLANKNSGGATHISNGVYYAVLDATDTNTLGPLIIFVHVSGALPVRVECEVLAANVYDSLIGGGDVLDVSVTQFAGSNVTQSGGRPEVNLSHIAGAAVSTTTAQLGVNVVQISGDGAAADNLETACDGGSYNVGGGGVVAASVTGAVGSVTGNVGGNVTGSVGSLAAQAKADVNAEVDTAIADARLDELLAADSDIDGAAPPTVGSVFHELMSKTTGSFTFDQTTDSLEAVRDRGDAAWITATGFSTLDAAGIRTAVGLANADLDTQLAALPTAAENADAVWDEALAGHAGAGSAGEALSAAGTAGDPWTTALPGAYGAGTAGNIIGNNLNATVSSRATQTSVDTIDDFLDTEVAAILADTNELQTDLVNGGRLDLLIDAIKAKTDNLPAAPAATGDIPTAAAVADAVWDEALSGHTTAGTGGKALADVLVDTAEIGAAGAGLTVLATQASVDAVKAKTDSLTFTVAGQVDANIQYVNDTQIQGTGAVGTDEWRAV